MSHLANSLGPQVRIEPCFCISSQKTEILQMMNCSNLQSNGKNSHVIIQNFYQLFIIKPSYLKSTFLTLSLSIFYNDQFLKVVHFELSFCLRRTSNASRCFAETIKVRKSVMWSRTRHPMRTLLSSAGSAEFRKQHGAVETLDLIIFQVPCSLEYRTMFILKIPVCIQTSMHTQNCVLFVYGFE